MGITIGWELAISMPIANSDTLLIYKVRKKYSPMFAQQNIKHNRIITAEDYIVKPNLL